MILSLWPFGTAGVTFCTPVLSCQLSGPFKCTWGGVNEKEPFAYPLHVHVGLAKRYRP